ncbi:MAG: four helix bundle protein [Candidatus Marinimicrobia bacterium]|nr:four helix bundle protein [Candidatus Neomarinimicrobiota bacterium]
MKSHKDLTAWQKAMDFVELIYKITGEFPENEKFGLTSQLRRASISIPSNLAEGAGRKSTKEFIQFLYIALGSSSEIETQLEIAMRLGYMKNQANTFDLLTDIRKLIQGLIRSLKKKV